MEEDLLNKALRQHAEQYTVQPELASIEEVMRRRNAAGKKKRLAFWLSAAVLAGLTAMLAYVFAPQTSQQIISSPVAATQPASTKQGPSAQDNATLQKAAEQSLPTEQKPAQQQQAPKTRTQAQHPQVYKTTTAIKPQEPFAALKKTTITQPILLNTGNPVAAEKSSDDQKEKVVPGALTPLSSEVIDTHVVVAQTSLQAAPDSIVVVAATPDSTAKKDMPPAQVVESKKWSVALVFNPQFVSRAYAANTTADLAWFDQKYKKSDRSDKAMFSYTAGARVQRELNKHWSLSSGLLFSKVQFQDLQVTQIIVHDSVKTTSTPFVNKERTIKRFDSTRYDNAFTFVEIPLMAHYSIHKNKWTWQMNLGVSYTYLLHTQSLYFNANDTLNAQRINDANNSRFQRSGIMINTGVVVQRHIHEHWCVYAGPIARYGLRPIYNKAYVNRQNPFFAGLEAGVKFLF